MTNFLGHLGEQAAAFVDGELDHDARDQVMGHLTRCAECRSEVAAQRLIKARLRDLVEPAPPASLLASLSRMSEPGEPLRPAARGPAGATRPPTVPVGGRPAPRPASRPSRQSRQSRRARRMRTTLVAGTTAVVATFVTAFAVGGAQESPSNTVTPDVSQYVVDHAATSRGLPFAELPADAVGVSYDRHPRR